MLHYPRHRAIVHAGSLVAASGRRFIVHGDAGSYLKDGLDVQEDQLRRGIAPGAPGWGLDPQHGHLVRIDADGHTQRSTVDNVPGDYRAFYAAFRDAMLGVGEAPVSTAQALQLMRLLDAGAESARSGRRVTLCIGHASPRSSTPCRNAGRTMGFGPHRWVLRGLDRVTAELVAHRRQQAVAEGILLARAQPFEQ